MADHFKSYLARDEAAGTAMDQTRRYRFIQPDALMGMLTTVGEMVLNGPVTASEAPCAAAGAASCIFSATRMI